MKKVAMFAAIVACVPLGMFAAVALAGDHPGGGHTEVTICHKPGTPAEKQLTFDDDGWKAHIGHGDTKGPCPTTTTPTETTPTETTPTETTPTTPTDVCPNLGGNQSAVPPGYKLENGVCVRVCPDGLPPTPGEGAYDPNDDCKRPPPTTTTSTTTPTPTAPPATLTTTTPTTAPPTPTATTPTPSTAPPKVKPVAKPKPPKAKPPKLTGDPKVDKCKQMGNGLARCKGVVVVSGSG